MQGGATRAFCMGRIPVPAERRDDGGTEQCFERVHEKAKPDTVGAVEGAVCGLSRASDPHEVYCITLNTA